MIHVTNTPNLSKCENYCFLMKRLLMCKKMWAFSFLFLRFFGLLGAYLAVDRLLSTSYSNEVARVLTISSMIVVGVSI